MKIYGMMDICGTILAPVMQSKEVDRFEYDEFYKKWALNTKTMGVVGFKKTVMETVENEVHNISDRLTAVVHGYFYYLYEVLDWVIGCDTRAVAWMEDGMISQKNGALLMADSKKAMIKGLRKLQDTRGSQPEYTLRCDAGMGIAAAELGSYGGITSTGVAVFKTVGHNLKEHLKRSAIKTLALLPENQRKKAVRYLKEKGVTLDHTYTVSGAVSEAKDNKKMNSLGYAVYVGPTEFMPCNPNGGICSRVIGSTLTCGQIASFLQRSTDNVGNRMGGIFN